MSHHDHEFDVQARSLHGAALRQLSPQTLARLRDARAQARQASPRRAWPWLAATAFTGVLAVALGLQFLPLRTPPATGTPTPMASTQVPATDTSGAVSVLDENPDLYLWLASSEAQPLAME